ncbi:hypothetical protein CQA70_29735 [Klebsiella pneumoniae]|nr:hypothetical protein CQA70_29735 [Klebsiella pneumoniae]
MRLVVNLFTIVAETAGVAASKSLRRSPEGRGSPTYPAYGPCDLSLIYSPLLLKLPVLRPQNR